MDTMMPNRRRIPNLFILVLVNVLFFAPAHGTEGDPKTGNPFDLSDLDLAPSVSRRIDGVYLLRNADGTTQKLEIRAAEDSSWRFEGRWVDDPHRVVLMLDPIAGTGRYRGQAERALDPCQGDLAQVEAELTPMGDLQIDLRFPLVIRRTPAMVRACGARIAYSLLPDASDERGIRLRGRDDLGKADSHQSTFGNDDYGNTSHESYEVGTKWIQPARPVEVLETTRDLRRVTWTRVREIAEEDPAEGWVRTEQITSKIRTILERAR